MIYVILYVSDDYGRFSRFSVLFTLQFRWLQLCIFFLFKPESHFLLFVNLFGET